MKCPRDATPLERVSIANMQLDRCSQCGGIWCDLGEMERVRDAGLAGIEQLLAQRSSTQTGEALAETSDAYMRCPRCEDPRLQRHDYTFTSRVLIDRCERCLGVWLDAGELEKIIAEKKKLDEEFGAPP